MWVRRVIYFQRVQEHCPRETYQARKCDLKKLSHPGSPLYFSIFKCNLHISVADISEQTFWDNDIFLRSMNVYFSLLYAMNSDMIR